MAITEVELTDEELKWIAHLAYINKEVTKRHYVAQGPDGQKYWICVFGEEYRGKDRGKDNGKAYEAWSPITNKGSWHYFGDPMPEWAGEPAQGIIVEDGFSLEEIEKAEEIMEGL